MKQRKQGEWSSRSGLPEGNSYDALGAQALHQQAFYMDQDRAVRLDNHDQAISRLHNVAKEIQRPQYALFWVEPDKRGGFVRCSDLGRNLLRVASADYDLILRDYPLHKFSPVMMVMLGFRRFLPVNPTSFFNRLELLVAAEQILATALRLVKVLQRMLKRPGVMRLHANFRRQAKNNFNGLIDALDRLSQCHTAVTSLRLDLYYGKEGSEPAKFGDEPDLQVLGEFLDCRDRFHRWFDRHFGKAVLGCAWVLEYGRERNFHIHYLVLLHPRGHEDDLALVEQFRQKWKEKTQGRGTLHSTNEKKGNITHRAVGLIQLGEPSVVEGLQYIASYMTLADLFVKLNHGQRFDTFGKGRFPKRGNPSPGRPKHRSPGSRIKISVDDAVATRLKFI